MSTSVSTSMAATIGKGQDVPPVKDAGVPKEPNIWDQIEAKYWEQISALHREEDRKLEESYRGNAEKLRVEKVRRHEESVTVVRKIQELQDRLHELAEEDAVAENVKRELDTSYEAMRLAVLRAREKEEREKRELFMTQRRTQNGARSAAPIATAPTSLDNTARPAPLADRPAQNSNIIRPKSPVVETADKQVQVVKELKIVQVVETQAKAVVNLPVNLKPVDQLESGQAMDLDTRHVTENSVADQEPPSVVPSGSDDHQDTPAPNGSVLPQETENGVTVQSEKHVQESIETESTVQKVAEVHDDRGIQNEAAAQGESEDRPVQNGPASQNEQRAEDAPVAGYGKEAQSGSADSQDPMQVETQNIMHDAQKGPNVSSDAETRPPEQVSQNSMEVDREGSEDVIRDPTRGMRLHVDTESSSELTSAHSTPLASPSFTSKPVTPVEEHFKGVDVYDGSGQLVGTVRHINLENRWVDHVKTLPVKRPVEIRPGRKFTLENLESIYEPSDAKGAKWLSCYIQATGEVQAQPCHTCTKNVGVFSQCVILGVEGFPRCGNCEWNRQGCYGASLLPKPREGEEPQSQSQSPSKPKTNPPPLNVTTGGFTAVNNPASGQNTRSPTEDGNLEKPARKALKGTPSQAKPPRKSLPSGSRQKSQSQADTPLATTPLTGSPAPESRDGGSEDLEEINQSVLEFEDDGTVFTKPEFMAGVPLEKISSDHPYWEKDWVPLEPLITATLRKWEEKLEHHKQTESGQASRFLANRQVNRGNSILEFLRDGELHPYQLVGKKYITKSLGSYDTVFRLVQVLGELRKFQIDVTPSQWLRHRLYEVWKQSGDGFILAKTVHNLYHDPKVSAIRAKSGFGNIGRPSGYRMEKDERPKRAPRGVKRKEPASTPGKSTPQQQQRRKSASDPKAEETSMVEPTEEPAKDPAVEPAEDPEQSQQAAIAVPSTPTNKSSNSNTVSQPRSSHRKSRTVSDAAEQQPQAQQNVQKEEARIAQGSPRQSKKQRVRSSELEAEDLMYDGYTTSDSFSNDHVMNVDWRVHQVKHARISTNTNVTQYWHFVDPDDGGEDGYLFEHQVLKDVMPTRVAWGVYKEPYDFHLRLAEITEATFSRGSKHVIIGTKEIPNVVFRGDLMVAFKRERTKKRFLNFLRTKGIKLVRTTDDYVEKAWKDMNPEVLPHDDSDD